MEGGPGIQLHKPPLVVLIHAKGPPPDAIHFRSCFSLATPIRNTSNADSGCNGYENLGRRGVSLDCLANKVRLAAIDTGRI